MSFDSTTLQSVRLTAQQLTENSQVLVIPNPEFPLARFADTFNVDAAPTNEPVTPELTAAVEEHFEEINQEELPHEEDDKEALISMVTASLAKVQFNTSNVIVPSIDSMVRDFNERQQASNEADVRIDIFNYDPIHSDPRLTTHVQSYANVNPQAEYRSFTLRPASTESIIDMVSINNPHLEREQVVEWLLKVQPEVIDSVYASLFHNGNGVSPSNLPFVVGGNAPFNIDALALAYFLCGHLTENPADVVGQSVDLDEWAHTMRMLHEMLGSYLLRAYLRRAEDRQNQVLVLRSDARSPVENRRVIVILNGDLAQEWQAAGGDANVILGCAVDDGGAQTIPRLNEKADRYRQRWMAIYPLIRQSAADQAARNRRTDMVEAFFAQAQFGTLAEYGVTDLRERLAQSIRSLREKEIENEYEGFARLICAIYFPEPTYYDYLQLMQQYGEQWPEASRRELSTQSLLTLVAIWIAQQIKVERYTPVVDAPAPVQQLEEPTGGEATDAIGDASTGEGPLADEPDAADGDDATGDDDQAAA
jgi:hypothetical protein